MIIELRQLEITGRKKMDLKVLVQPFLRKMKCREEKKRKGNQKSSDIWKENEKGIEEEHH